MARISTYTIDSLDTNDKLHGTDQNGVTRNFQMGPSTGGGNTTIVNYITECDPSALGWQYHNLNYNGNGAPQPGSIIGNNNNVSTAFSALSTLKVSKFPFATALASGSNMTAENILAEYVGQRVKFHDVSNPNYYGIFDVTGIAVNGTHSDFFDVAVTHVSSNSSWNSNPSGATPAVPAVYVLEIWVGPDQGDKHFTHTQQNASSTWTVTHNLGKFPAVQAVIGNTIFIPDVEHINNNQLKIYLSSDNSGKAYCN
jgi:hypothetical protein